MDTITICNLCKHECESYTFEDTFTDDAWGQNETFTLEETLSLCCDFDVIEVVRHE